MSWKGQRIFWINIGQSNHLLQENLSTSTPKFRFEIQNAKSILVNFFLRKTWQFLFPIFNLKIIGSIQTIYTWNSCTVVVSNSLIFIWSFWKLLHAAWFILYRLILLPNLLRSKSHLGSLLFTFWKYEFKFCGSHTLKQCMNSAHFYTTMLKIIPCNVNSEPHAVNCIAHCWIRYALPFHCYTLVSFLCIPRHFGVSNMNSGFALKPVM